VRAVSSSSLYSSDNLGNQFGSARNGDDAIRIVVRSTATVGQLKQILAGPTRIARSKQVLFTTRSFNDDEDVSTLSEVQQQHPDPMHITVVSVDMLLPPRKQPTTDRSEQLPPLSLAPSLLSSLPSLSSSSSPPPLPSSLKYTPPSTPVETEEEKEQRLLNQYHRTQETKLLESHAIIQLLVDRCQGVYNSSAGRASWWSCVLTVKHDA
jgi:hypothetical protein